MMADYLPYGGLISGSGLNVTENDYLWTGKELQHQLFDTPSYDSSARLLFTNGLFASPDPLAEKYPGISPYAYCAENPVNLMDPEGRDIWTINSNGEILWKESCDNHYLYYVDDSGSITNDFIAVSNAELLYDLENASKLITRSNGTTSLLYKTQTDY